MAFQKSFTDNYGNSYANSYWYIGRVTIDKYNNGGTLHFLGFKDKAARDSGKQPVGEKLYNVQGETFQAYLTSLITGQNALALGYEIALNEKEILVLDENGNNILNEDGTNKKVSFFDGATQV